MLLDISAHAYWIKALHIVCVILWVGSQLVMGMLILALRQMQNQKSTMSSDFIVRVDWFINGGINLAMTGAFVLGGLMASLYWSTDAPLPTWLWLKAGLVFMLATIHGLLYRQYKQVKRGHRIWSVQAFDWLQLSSLVLSIIIVILVMVKPSMN